MTFPDPTDFKPDVVRHDFLGSEYRVGDTIVYAGMSGRSVQMVLATVVKFNDNGSVAVQPTLGDGSRWKQHYGRTRYVDSRTGKGINPYSGEKHYKKLPYCRHDGTGEEVSCEEFDEMRGGLRPGEWQRWQYQSGEFHEYVQEIHDGPKPVTLHITENIIKVAAPEVGATTDENAGGTS